MKTKFTNYSFSRYLLRMENKMSKHDVAQNHSPVFLSWGKIILFVAMFLTVPFAQSAINQTTIAADEASQIITWENPSNITYGTALSATQLNATVMEGSGALTYTPDLGTVLSAGTHILKVTAAATENYIETSREVTIVVDKADPIITIESSSTTSTYGDSVTFTVTVSGFGSNAPTGNVVFRCVATVLGTDTLIQGKATLITSRLEADDTHSPNALYVGDDNYNSVTSSYLSHYVSKKTLTISGTTIEPKVYDGTTIGHISVAGLLHGIVNGDTVTIDTADATIEFADKNVNSSIPVTVSGLTLGGPGSYTRSYILTQPDGLTGNITPKPITISGITAADKVYDGTTVATVIVGTELVGVVSGDELTLLEDGVTGIFVDKNAATEVIVTTNGFGISGEKAGNYLLIQPEVTAKINKAPLTITAENKSKLSDGAIYSDAYTVSYSGFVNAETEAILNGSLIFTGEATTATSAGLYDIIPSGLTASNYEITFINGKLNIIDVSTNTNNIEDTKLTVTVYPNPAVSDYVNFKFGLKKASKVSIDIFDTKGLLIDCIFSGNIQDNDIHIVTYKNNLPVGTYIYRLKSGSEVITGKLMIAK